MIQIVIPMAGESSRFIQEGYIPKPFLPLVDGKSIIETVEDHVLSLARRSGLAFNTSILLKESYLHNRVYKSILANLLSNLYKINTPNLGPLSTICQAMDDFDDDDSLIIYDCDQLSLFSIEHLVREGRGALVTLKHNDPGFSYIERGSLGNINRVVEKQVVSDEACAGVYYFPSVKIFKKAALHDFANNLSLNGEFRIANLFNFLIKNNIQVDSYKCGRYFSLGTPSDYNHFVKNNIDSYKAYCK